MADAMKLLPCPFCGSEMILRGGVNPYGRCDTPECWMKARACTVPTDEPVQCEAWNLRASPPARKEAPAEGAGDEFGPTEAEIVQTAVNGFRSDLSALRNRTSEPEAGAVIESDAAMAERFYVQAWMKAGKTPPLAWADLPAEQRAAKIEAVGDFRSAVGLGVYAPAPATADKLRMAVEALEKADALASRSHDALEEVRDFLRTRHPGTDLYEVVTSALYDLRTRQALAALNEQPQ